MQEKCQLLGIFYNVQHTAQQNHFAHQMHASLLESTAATQVVIAMLLPSLVDQLLCVAARECRRWTGWNAWQPTAIKHRLAVKRIVSALW